MLLRLVVVAGNVEAGTRSIALSEGPVYTIGRSPGCDIRVPELSVARRQCDIAIRGGAAWLLDYGFTRGVWFGSSVSVNGRPVFSVENFWPEAPREPPEGTTQAHLDHLNDLADFVDKQKHRLTWHPLQGGDEIRVGTAVFAIVHTPV